jgi:hypothetical protein
MFLLTRSQTSFLEELESSTMESRMCEANRYPMFSLK